MCVVITMEDESVDVVTASAQPPYMAARKLPVGVAGIRTPELPDRVPTPRLPAGRLAGQRPAAGFLLAGG
jgi:hypothetical protein